MQKFSGLLYVTTDSPERCFGLVVQGGIVTHATDCAKWPLGKVAVVVERYYRRRPDATVLRVAPREGGCQPERV